MVLRTMDWSTPTLPDLESYPGLAQFHLCYIGSFFCSFVSFVRVRDGTNPIRRTAGRTSRFLVALDPVRDLLLRAKHLFVAAKTVWASVTARRVRG
jgi:hypothetical protein